MKNNILISLLSFIVGGAVVWFVIGRTPGSSQGNMIAPAKPAATLHQAEMEDTPERTKSLNRPRERKPRNEELEEFADKLKDKVVVNLGTVEDMGRQTAAMLLASKELAELQAIPANERTAAQNQRLLDLQRQKTTAMGVLPEIAGFQNDPDQYGHYFASLLHDAAGLNDSQTSAAYDYMKGRGQSLVQAGLNTANEPDDPSLKTQWEAKRDAFNAATATGVAAMLAPGEAERIGFTPDFLELLEQDFDKAEADH